MEEITFDELPPMAQSLSRILLSQSADAQRFPLEYWRESEGYFVVRIVGHDIDICFNAHGELYGIVNWTAEMLGY